MHAPSPTLRRLALARRLGVGALSGLLLATASAMARTRATASPPQPALVVPSTQPIESPPPTTSGLPAVQTTVPPMGAAPVQTPAITAVPIAHPPFAPKDVQSQQRVQKLQQLQRAAAPASGYGSTRAAAQAAWQLGLIYLHGAGVRIDRPLAQQWFERAAQKNLEPWAFAGLAWCALDGCAAPPHPESATSAIARLRRSQPGRADFLAWVQATQRQPLQIAAPGVDSSSNNSNAARSALVLLQRAAAAGDSAANIELGVMAFAQQDLQQAQTYFRRVAATSTFAAHNLSVVQTQSRPGAAPALRATDSVAETALDMAHMYHRGQGVPANFAEAVRFYRLAEQRGSTEARKMLELIFSRPMPDGSLNVAWMQQLANASPSASGARGFQLGSGVYALQMQRPPTPLFDLLPTFWQQQVQAISL